jgi:lipopolysaccharide transport system permease protein
MMLCGYTGAQVVEWIRAEMPQSLQTSTSVRRQWEAADLSPVGNNEMSAQAELMVLPVTTAPEPVAELRVTIIEPRSGWRLVDWQEIYRYRDLFLFLTWRQLKVQYAQSALGVGWAVIQPLFSMLIFTIVFGRLVKVSSDGVPYALFSFVALVAWSYFSNAVTEGTNSLVSNTNLLTKVYFPRLVLPLSAVAGKLVDFSISLVLLGLMMTWWRIAPTAGVVFLPLFVLIMVLSAAGLGLWLTALAVQYRDVKYALNFVMQLLMYASPVVYPTSLVPEKLQLVYALNPMVGVIEGFRSALLGTRPMPFDLVAVSGCSAVVLAVTGCLYFRRRERIFADVA